jgi:glycosyltransferase involved in cell wall biosynthesis
LYEGLGSALIEAQANGLHVVTSAGVVPNEIDVTGKATFVPLSDGPEIWSEKVLEHCGRKDAEAANRKVAEKYEIQTITDILARIYTKAEF